jgi:dipeptidyl aminopeptidase/acylaminoacyl peptidase
LNSKLFEGESMMRIGHLIQPVTLVLVASLLVTQSPSVRVVEADEPGAWTPESEMKVKNVGAVRVSADGKRAVYTVAEAVMTPDKSEFVTQLWMANTDGSDSYQVTFGEKSSTDPQWSPDGKWLAYTSSRTGKNNLFLLRTTGGEAEQLTDVKTGVAAFAWSPDNLRIALTMRDPQSEDEEKATKGKDDSRWIDENVKMNHLYVVNIQKDDKGKRELRKLTSGDFNVETDFDWAPDGKTLAFTKTRMPKADYWTTGDVMTVDVAGAEVKPLAVTGAAESRPLYSPDGKWIAVNVTDNPARWAGNVRINIVAATGGAPRPMAWSYDAQPGTIGWSADGQRLFFGETRGTVSRVYALDLSSNSISDVSKVDSVLGGVDMNRSHTMFGFTMQKNDAAPEAFVSRVDQFSPVQISHANGDLPKFPVARTEVIRWKSTDGTEIEGLLTYPVNYQSGARVPLLMMVHGGPAGVFTQAFLVSNRSPYPLAVFAARGYAVLRVNPRGSSGYGQKFRYGNLKDWGGGDYKDLMTGIDRVIDMGVADPERLGVMGWSYGGFMTSWIITQTHRFKAASVGAGVTNTMSFVGTSDIPAFIPDYFGAQPWEDLEVYRQHSAMFNIKGVVTPTLIQHGEADERVPISQGYEFYNALKVQNVPVRMIVLPRMPHGPNEPKMVLRAKQSNLEWFEKYLGGK